MLWAPVAPTYALYSNHLHNHDMAHQGLSSKEQRGLGNLGDRMKIKPWSAGKSHQKKGLTFFPVALFFFNSHKLYFNNIFVFGYERVLKPWQSFSHRSEYSDTKMVENHLPNLGWLFILNWMFRFINKHGNNNFPPLWLLPVRAKIRRC